LRKKFRIKNPLAFLFKPKEKPDDPLSRIPEEWKKKTQPTVNGQATVTETQETRRGRGRPAKKAEVLVPTANVKPAPQKAQAVHLPPRRPVKLRSYQERFKFKSIPHFRQIKRVLAAFLLFGMVLSTIVLFITAPIYAPILTMAIGFILIDYLWITGLPKVPKETIKFKDPEMFAEWLRKQNVVFEVENKEES
jgi:hypothetical protein